MPKLSIATNVSGLDHLRFPKILAHWRRAFGNLVDEFVILVDLQKPEQRIFKQHHTESQIDCLIESILPAVKEDPRLKIHMLDPEEDRRTTALRWFGKRLNINRAIGGSIIYGYLRAIDLCQNPIILKLDSDMACYKTTWLSEAIKLLDENPRQLISPSRFDQTSTFSTRCFTINRDSFLESMGHLIPFKQDSLRQLRNYIKGHSSFLPLEQILQKHIDRNEVHHKILSPNLGGMFHIALHDYFVDQQIGRVLTKIESGSLSLSQLNHGWEYLPQLWKDVS